MGRVGANRKRAFSLFELMIVIGFLALLIGMGSVAIISTMNSYRITASLGQLQADLAYGSQLARTKNQAVELRFFRHSFRSGGFDTLQFRSYQFLKIDQEKGIPVAISRVIALDPGVIIHPNPQFSTLLSLPKRVSTEIDKESGKIGPLSDQFEFVSLIFDADGSLRLTPDYKWSVTIVNEESGHRYQTLPDHYRCLVINPANGAVQAY